MNKLYTLVLVSVIGLTGCSSTQKKASQTQTIAKSTAPPAVTYFKVDPATAGTIVGKIHFAGKKPVAKRIDMSEDPACVEAHHGRAYEETIVTGAKAGLTNAFIHVKSGLEGKNFETPSAPVTIDQRGCWFTPRVVGIQTGQTLSVINSDPVTHNIHPLAEVNREWNHSQGSGDPPLARRFTKPEIMIPVKCNIHSWMHAFIGVVANPYFAVSGSDGTFEIRNLPPGNYVLEAWHEGLGTQDQNVTVAASGRAEADFTFKGK